MVQQLRGRGMEPTGEVEKPEGPLVPPRSLRKEIIALQRLGWNSAMIANRLKRSMLRVWRTADSKRGRRPRSR